MSIAEAVVKMWLGGSHDPHRRWYRCYSRRSNKFIATQFFESKFGKDVADIERQRQRIAYAAVSRRDAPLTIVSPLDDYFYPDVANKGAMVWRFLREK